MSLKSGIRAPSKKSTDSSRNIPSRNGSEVALSRSSSVSTLASVAEGKESVASSFVIGDRVWVNGTKPGYVQYIGETQFAPGIWAGVKLDDNEGKNDGSVGGVKYFDCEPQRGIFIRPHRLTREAGAPPAVGDATSPVSKGSGLPSGLGRQGTPPRSGLMSPPKGACSKLRPGERVVVNSTGGVKLGILRYLGPTEFAVGDWAGIELDEPLGRNDGSVGDKRYFECTMKHGLFAPVHKVSRAGGTMTTRSTSHSGSFSRSCSKESLNSSVSSVSSSRAGRVKLGITSLNAQKPPRGSALSPTQSAMQEALKEKEEHIAQLLKERDLERSEVARSAVETEETRQRILKLQEDFSIAMRESEAKIQQLQSNYEKVQKDAKNISALFEEEKRKIEDLQFQLEEELIMKGETEAQLEREQQKCKDLETLLKDDKKSEEFVKQLASLQESFKARDKVASGLEHELDIVRVQLCAKEAEVHQLSAHIEEVKQSLEKAHNECEKVNSLNEKIVALEKENKQLSEIQKELSSEIDDMKKRIIEKELQHEELTAKILALETDLKIKEEEVLSLNAAVENERVAKLQMSENLQAVDVLEIAERKAQENLANVTRNAEALSKELISKEEKLKESILVADSLQKASEEKSMEVSKLTNQLQELEKQYKDELEKNKFQATGFQQKICSLQKELLQKEENHKQTIESLASQLEEQKCQKTELESRVVMLTIDLNKKEDIVTQLSKRLEDVESEIAALGKDKSESLVLLQDKIAQMRKESDQTQTEAATALANVCSEKDELLKLLQEQEQLVAQNAASKVAVEKSLSDKENQLLQMSSEFKKAEEKMENTTKIIDTLQEQIRKLSEENQERELYLNEKKTSEDQLKKKVQSLTLLLKDQESSKVDLESQVAALSTDLNKKAETILQLSKKLHDAESEITVLGKDKSESLVLLQAKLSEMRKESDQAQTEAATALANACAEKEHLSKLLKEQEQLASTSAASTAAFQKSISEKESQLSNISHELEETKGKMEIMAKNMDSLQKQIHKLSEENVEKENSLTEKEEILTSLSAEISKYAAILKDNSKVNAERQNEVQSLKVALASKEEQIMELASLVEVNQSQLELLKVQNEDNVALMENRVESFRQQQEKHLLEKERVLHTEIEKLQGKLCERDKALESSLSQISEWQTQVQQRDSDIEKLRQLLEHQKSSNLQQKDDVADFESKLLLLQKQCEQLEKEKNEIAQKEHAAREAHQALEKAKDILMHDKNEQEALVKDRDAKLHMLQQEVERMRCEFIQHKDQLQGKLDVSQMELEAMKEFKSELEMQQGVMEELQQQLQDAENDKFSLEEQLKNMPLVEDLKTQIHNLKKELLDATNKIKEEGEKRLNVENQLRNNQEVLKEKGAEIEVLKAVHITSKDTAHLSTRLKALESEKLGLLSEISKLKTLAESNSNKSNFSDETGDEEEKEALKSQINFLNSIIVDMQRKNEELKNKQESLNEPLDADLNFNGVRQIPPRLFCDICDMFDLHDTDDCPKQSSFSEEVPHSKHHGNRHEERPYCNNCEIFGHWTLECNEQETF